MAAAFGLLLAGVLPPAGLAYTVGLLLLRRLNLTVASQIGGFLPAWFASVIAALLIATRSTVGAALDVAVPAGFIGAVVGLALIVAIGRRRDKHPVATDRSSRWELLLSRARLAELGGWTRLWVALSAAWTIIVVALTFYGYTPSGLTYDERIRWITDIRNVLQFRRRVIYADGRVEEEPFSLDLELSPHDDFRSCDTDDTTGEFVCDFAVLVRYDEAWPLEITARRCVDESSCDPKDDWEAEILPSREGVREEIRIITESYARRAYWKGVLRVLLAGIGCIVGPSFALLLLGITARWISDGFRRSAEPHHED